MIEVLPIGQKRQGFAQSIAGAQNGVQYLVTSIYDSTDLNSFANSTIEDNNTSTPGGSINANKFSIGASGNSGNPLDGNFQEFIIWNADQNEQPQRHRNEYQRPLLYLLMYYTSQNRSELVAYNESVNNEENYSGTTITWANIIEHPNKADFAIKKHPNYDAELTLVESLSEDWFPPIEE